MSKRKPDRAILRAAFFETVDNQIRDNDPPETKQTLQRLIAEGHSREEARRLIAYIVAYEIFGILKDSRPFDRVHYVAALRRLPELPDEG
jgi:hypothetical protein